MIKQNIGTATTKPAILRLSKGILQSENNKQQQQKMKENKYQNS